MSYIFHYRLRGADGTEREGKVFSSELLTAKKAEATPEIQEQLREVGGEHYTLLSFEMPDCDGCRENQPNQQAHMDYGGCLYDAEE